LFSLFKGLYLLQYMKLRLLSKLTVLQLNTLTLEKINLNKDTRQQKAAAMELVSARNDLIRDFSLDKVSTWVDKVSKDNINQLNANEIMDNINSIKSLSIQTQTFIHGVCSKITDSMKLYDLKLKEIEVLEKEIQREKGIVHAKPLPNKDEVLLKKLNADKKKVSRTVKEVVSHHNKLLKVVQVYNKKFAEKHGSNIKELLKSITIQLKSFMGKPHFKKAYKLFMVLLLKKIQEFSPDALKNPEPTARTFIADNWNRILNDITKKTDQKNLEKKFPALEKGNKDVEEELLFD